MHPVLRQRLMRRLETLPDDQVYQVLDFIEFLEAKYAEAELRKEATGLQRFGERLEDSLRRRTIGPGTLREAFHLIAGADRVLSSVASAGRDLLGEWEVPRPDGRESQPGTDGAGADAGERARREPTGGRDPREGPSDGESSRGEVRRHAARGEGDEAPPVPSAEKPET